jgi:hypothetical protein
MISGVDVSQADYLFLTAQQGSVAATAYEQVLSRIPSFNGSAVRDQLELCRQVVIFFAGES